MRTTWLTSVTKILPSPILPVRAALMIASTVGHDDFHLHLGQEIDHVLGATIKFGVALLPAEALHFRHGEPGNADLGEGLAHFVQLERLDHGFDAFHKALHVRTPVDTGMLSDSASPCQTRAR